MVTGSSQSMSMWPPHSPTRITKKSILKLAGAFHWPKTSRIRFWAFSYSMGEPCGRSNQLMMYFMGVLSAGVKGVSRPISFGAGGFQAAIAPATVAGVAEQFTAWFLEGTAGWLLSGGGFWVGVAGRLPRSPNLDGWRFMCSTAACAQ